MAIGANNCQVVQRRDTRSGTIAQRDKVMYFRKSPPNGAIAGLKVKAADFTQQPVLAAKDLGLLSICESVTPLAPDVLFKSITSFRGREISVW